MKNAALILIAVALAACNPPTQAQIDAAEAALAAPAKAWGKSMGLDVVGATCMTWDTDGDGYVSCTLSVRSDNGKVDILPIECASQYAILAQGCRHQRATLQR